ncbi:MULTISPECIES: GAF domain-containing sensor histidine kinase [unclassified Leeuwenhoekiella]|uniref:GAF domain-containing sensor histidine kinase n=1 Tax=unclassified Leeuwenhoekiella TaxID=2615029 RepID=UPI000C4EFD60|nr:MULTISPECIES: GAF domain-containing sensor histidine kinase [unclassified Leeuwenhoekiella]MAW94926.1 ATPase [Leeuwenhoekiella sp.]MBA79646.1 ATPase [Leeuwenhoekiella sp.]|tara:strand:- start:4343 stop:5551 length:1209 start_codon:yes stop_codon:yes gene_type:complete
MQVPALPIFEPERLIELEELQLSYEPDVNYDVITRLASAICETPVALITILDAKKQHFKSKIGTDLCDTDRDISFCAHAILKPREITIVNDARKDPRFKDNPLTTQENPVIFYAGVPLLTKKGQPLGTLCVIDSKPKTLTDSQINSLRDLASQVENLFELRRNNLKLLEIEQLLQKKNEQLRKFAGTVSHDMKMPLANMIITTDILRAKYAPHFDAQGNNYLSYLKQSSFSLSDYIDNLLSYYESEEQSVEQAEAFDLQDLLEDLIDLLNINEDYIINLPENPMELVTNKSAVNQILLNLITNSLKYNDKETGIITIQCTQDQAYYYVQVSDNGKGIPKDKQEIIFDLFSTATEADNKGKKGNGIGLSTVRNLVQSLGGIISVSSEEGNGATFDFTIKKVLS